ADAAATGPVTQTVVGPREEERAEPRTTAGEPDGHDRVPDVVHALALAVRLAQGVGCTREVIAARALAEGRRDDRRARAAAGNGGRRRRARRRGGRRDGRG